MNRIDLAGSELVHEVVGNPLHIRKLRHIALQVIPLGNRPLLKVKEREPLLAGHIKIDLLPARFLLANKTVGRAQNASVISPGQAAIAGDND